MAGRGAAGQIRGDTFSPKYRTRGQRRTRQEKGHFPRKPGRGGVDGTELREPPFLLNRRPE